MNQEIEKIISDYLETKGYFVRNVILSLPEEINLDYVGKIIIRAEKNDNT